jgi:rusticyanin
MNRYRLFGIGSAIILAVVIIVSVSFFWGGSNSSSQQSAGQINQNTLASLNVTPADVYVSVSNSTIYVNGSATLLVVMGPMNAPSMYSFEIFGIINPTVVIKDGSVVNFTVVNVDTDSYHNFVLSQQGPPYNDMGNMMGSSGLMFSMQYLNPEHSGIYSYQNVSYTFSSPGTYWYLCTYPGHAANGMYGEILVSR